MVLFRFWAPIIALFTFASAQHQNHQMPDSTMEKRMAADHIMPLLNGSGTSWFPVNAPMHAIPFRIGSWSAMSHGSFYLRYTDHNANHPDLRGTNAVDAPNWVMLMAQSPRFHENNSVSLRLMVSADRATEGGDGYPLLFQTGETWQGEPLVDRQHPHDLFMELAGQWSYHLQNKRSLFIYLGYPGEPALGPTAYMHRPSGETNPDAVLGHHYQDATHISFGVATLGAILDKFKIDASIFTGREPGENRLNFDRPRFNSYSARISLRPNANWESQISAGFIKSPEAIHPEEDIIRTSASITNITTLGRKNTLATTLGYGGNLFLLESERILANSIFLESELSYLRWIGYMRHETIGKLGKDLVIPEEEEIFWINALTFGGARVLANLGIIELLLGGQSSIFLPERDLESFYGNIPLSYEIYLKLRPKKMAGGVGH